MIFPGFIQAPSGDYFRSACYHAICHQRRDELDAFIDDITTAIENLSKELATRPEGYSDIVNIGGGKPHSLNDLIMVISQQIPSKLNTTESLSNPNDTIYTNADVTLLKELTNIVPNIDLQNGVTRTISWAMQEKIREKLTTWTNSTI